MTIDDLHQFIRLIANKNQQGYLAPDQINRAVNRAELQLFKDRLGPPEKYPPGRALPAVAYPLTQKVEDDLAPFLVRAAFTPTLTTPHWDKPAGFLHPVDGAVRATYQPVRGWDVPATDPLPAPRACEVTVVTASELATRLAADLNPPTPAAPVATVTATQVEFYPVGALLTTTIPYLALPVFSRWVGTVGPNGRLGYDPINSVQTQFPADTSNDLAMRALAYLGIHLSAPDVSQFAQVKTQQG